uniref:26S proteasome non-ATPase regulatory subunit 2 homolog n=1 Tax=Aureoumbra lagunensis TaxID=44058 RepID=A0A7S3K485_9STRA|mmetsp:Transcript_7649/g.11507  ORF Transcript_7649/g.11507 Transcript_7649/m.11507 type:complete len:957 (-) Transcript_7649:346-3216(-)|eukprot:CAMPEP_0197289014 /NCGR_PEP_ID=MMETSP0890-20130614/6219_1 /TAXON_ID=44058 ORGANISM="Aureoumbra lagunensis, Strain CCMP1510" /NCGR_SAMPLE_ID=MMETSP0890 /ASSEMBLY_ACC=CAM_ASM_000533 /LENGTH=956 /DNA_ID=CAMNT_0042760147 /DNA_START=48 /DNA_END=2918 /DNA_ORIENTATION=+
MTTEEKKESKDEEKEDEKKVEEVELSAEDQALLEGLELAVERLQENDAQVQAMALEHLVKEVRAATSSMTSVPKPLKFLRPHYDTLKNVFQGQNSMNESNKAQLADLLAVLAMTMAKAGSREMLSFKKQGTKELGSWGHEFVRSLAGEIGEEWAALSLEMSDNDDSSKKKETLLSLVDDIVPFHLQHNAEAEAIDLLIETQQLGRLQSLQQSKLIHIDNYRRICLYLLRCAAYMPDPEELRELLVAALQLYRAMGQYPDAVRVALYASSVLDNSTDDTAMEDDENNNTTTSSSSTRLENLFDEAPDAITKQQMAFIVARNGLSDFEYEKDSKVNEILGNNMLHNFFLALAKDLDVEETKAPEDIYKSHLGDSYSSAATGGTNSNSARNAQRADSAKANLASTLVNCFVNCAYGTDTLMTIEGNEWLYKNKDHGMLTAAASLGMIMMWDVEEGLTKIDKFLHSTDDNVKAGACLAIGLVSANIRHDADPPIALLPEYLDEDADSTPVIVKVAASTALGIAYAGCQREDAKELLASIVQSHDDVALASLAALSLGEIYVGSCDQDVAGTILQRLMETPDVDLDRSIVRFLALGLALVFLGSMDKADATLEALKTIDHEIARYASVALDSMAYAGTGNVLKVQRMLHICAERLDTPQAGTEETKNEPPAPPPAQNSTNSDTSTPPPVAKEAKHQSVAVLGIALVTAGDDVGSDMVLRTFDHLLHYGEPSVRRAVPLALALLKVGNPEYAVVDAMSRLTHDADNEVTLNAIVGLGLLACGTNNSRVAGLLRQLAEHSRDPNHLFVVRLAQGLLHLGKGLLGISPHHSDRFLLSKPALAGLTVFIHACLDMKHTLLDKYHFLAFHLATAIMPRYLLTVDANSLELLPASVRVGQAVETVGQPGNAKSITGFQTHTTPVLLGVTDRAQLANDDYIPLSTTLEGIILLSPNPDAASKQQPTDG